MTSKIKPKSKPRKKAISIPRLQEKAQKVFNTWIRQRDLNATCISCGSTAANQAGHYFPVRGFSALRYEPLNVHLQCAGCNCYRHGNPHMYRIELPNRIGLIAMDFLEHLAITAPDKKWTRAELQSIIEQYGRI